MNCGQISISRNAAAAGLCSVRRPRLTPRSQQGITRATSFVFFAASVNARILGKESELGTIEPGKLAGIRVVKGYPVFDIVTLSNVDVVVKDGVLYAIRHASMTPSAIEHEPYMIDKKRPLIWHGMFLFLLGLLLGLAEQKFTNTRMGLAAHLEGVMNGTFLIALGAIWAEVKLSPRLKAAAYWSALAGAYGNLAITTLAAIFGTAALSPITGIGHRGLPWQEGMVTIGFATLGIAVIGSSILILCGLRRNA
jgi:(hydroxyamino)benzene mutase